MSNYKVNIKKVDFTSKKEVKTLIELLNEYALDPMGGGKALDPKVIDRLPESLAQRTDALSFIAYEDNQNKAIGILNAFEGFSTFAGRPLANIHDVYVKPEWRGKKVTQNLILALEKLAIERCYCKLTMEVLDKNISAKRAYNKVGFSGFELDPEVGQAVFWQKEIG